MKYEKLEMSNKNISTPHLNPGLIKGKRRFGERAGSWKMEDGKSPSKTCIKIYLNLNKNKKLCNSNNVRRIQYK